MSAPLVLALPVKDGTHYLIIEGHTPAQRADLPTARGPMSEDALRAILAEQFGMGVDTIEQTVADARRQLRERTATPSVEKPAPELARPWVERRDHAVRTARVQRLLERVSAHDDGIALSDLATELTPEAAERILKPLALRGLVRVADGRWAPRQSLRMGLNLPLRAE